MYSKIYLNCSILYETGLPYKKTKEFSVIETTYYTKPIHGFQNILRLNNLNSVVPELSKVPSYTMPS